MFCIHQVCCMYVHMNILHSNYNILYVHGQLYVHSYTRQLGHMIFNLWSPTALSKGLWVIKVESHVCVFCWLGLSMQCAHMWAHHATTWPTDIARPDDPQPSPNCCGWSKCGNSYGQDLGLGLRKQPHVSKACKNFGQRCFHIFDRPQHLPHGGG